MSGPHPPDDASLARLTPTERKDLAAVYGKLMRNERTSRKEAALLAQFEKQREERLRWQYYRSIPKKHWRQMSGRQTKVLNEQAARYGLPIGGPVIDLSAVVMAVHDFLAANAQRLAQEDDPLLRTAESSPALERYRRERARVARMDRLERQRALLPREGVRSILDRLANLIRRAIERLERKHGADAAEIVRRAIEDFERETDQHFASKLPLGEEDD